ncbi:MAG: RNA methyltransferase [Elusimicrobia bacterium]|nr:RNA methyltransferase [Elusimicrobiota bacterium]
MNLRFVLVRPRNPLNIGAAARAMANFGFNDLVVVKPFAPVWRETTSAVGAEQLVREARAFSSIDEAIADCHLVVGTTALRARRLERPVVSLPNLADYLAREDPSPWRKKRGETFQTAILFGPEKTGLSTPYLERCHFWLTIPTDPACPSMNMGQSVALCAYEWARSLHRLAPRPLPGPSSLATTGDLDRLVRQVMDLFEAADYLPFLPRSSQERKVRRLFQRWRIHRQDVQLMHGLFRFLLQGLAGDSPRGR